MKKVVLLVIAIVLVVAMAVPTFAVSQNDIIAKLQEGFTVGSTHKTIPASYIKLAEDFLNANELSEDQINEALALIDEVEQVWIDSGVKNFSDLPKSVVDKMINKVEAVADDFGITINVSGGSIVITDSEGREYGIDNLPIKQTGVEHTALYAISAITLILFAAAVVIARKYQLNRA